MSTAFSQKKDTVYIDGTKVNTAVLKPGTNRYLVYFKNGKDSNRINHSIWTRTVEYITHHSTEAIAVRQSWESKDSVYHRAYSINDRKTFAPLFHETWWWNGGSSVFDLLEKRAAVRNIELTDTSSNPAMKKVWDAYKTAVNDRDVFNWHLDLETFALLPYKDDAVFVINFYDPGYPAPEKVIYSVAGSDILPGFNNQKIDCWLLKHTEGRNIEKYWISKQTKEVLQVEDEFGRGRYRYKVKLPFSI